MTRLATAIVLIIAFVAIAAVSVIFLVIRHIEEGRYRLNHSRGEKRPWWARK